ETHLETRATAGNVSTSATPAASANPASAIVARDASGNFTAGTITEALAGNATTATTAAMADNLAGGAAGNIVYQSAANTSAMLSAGTADYILQSNGAGLAPTWTNAPTISGANITGIPAANIGPGNLGPQVVASSIAVGAVYPGAVAAGTYGVNITGNANTASNMSGGSANQMLYQSSLNNTAFVAAPGINMVLFGNNGAPQWTNTPSFTGTNVTSIPWANVLKTGSSLAQLETRSASVLDSGILPLARLSGITNAEISESAAISDTKLDIIATAGKVSNTATTATNLNTGGAIVARDASGNFTAGTITAALAGNAATATTATLASSLAGGAAGNIVYQSGNNTSAMLAAGAVNFLLQGNGAAAPLWTNAPTVSGANITGLPAANIADGKLGAGVVASSIAVNAVYPGAVAAGTYGVNISGNANTASNLNGGAANQVLYQSGLGATAFVAVPGANSVLFANGGAPSWSNAPTLTGTNITGLPWAGVLKTGSTLADLETRSAADLTSGVLPLARLSGITNTEIAAAAAIVDTKLATISTAGKVSNSATTATNLNTASSIVARDASGNFTAGTITADLAGNATTATTAANAATAATAANLAGGQANQMPYQSAANATTFVAAPGLNMVLFGNGGAPAWSNTPAFTATNVTGLPWTGVLKNGSTLADLETRSAADLNSGILPLARLSGITNAEIAAAAGIVDSKLATIAAAGKVSNSATT
ncbi:MAG: hypothetical protein NTY45_00160, partial [Elusimicrobia bacterium]|nr:hypothetical protein [Elusimicrobiota bacterium]